MAKATAQPEVTADTQEAPPSTPVDTTPQAPAEATAEATEQQPEQGEGTQPEGDKPETKEEEKKEEKKENEETINLIKRIENGQAFLTQQFALMDDVPSQEQLDALCKEIVTMANPDAKGDKAITAWLLNSDLQLVKAIAVHQNLVKIEKNETNETRKASASLASMAFSAYIVQTLDAQRVIGRVDLCSDNGHGLYLEAGPEGHAGFGFGVISKETKNEVTTVKRTGVGVYLRADHFARTARRATCAF
jgi:hypothetical protein